MSRIVLLDPKVLSPPPSHVNFSNFQTEEFISFSTFLRRLGEKRTGAIPLTDQVSEHVLKINSKNDKVGHHIIIGF